MLLQPMFEESEFQIVVNSFYDVFPEFYSEDELEEYKQLVGMPLAKSYEELMACLK